MSNYIPVTYALPGFYGISSYIFKYKDTTLIDSIMEKIILEGNVLEAAIAIYQKYVSEGKEIIQCHRFLVTKEELKWTFYVQDPPEFWNELVFIYGKIHKANVFI